MNEYIKVAGVTFPNDDGESRQTILKNIGFGFHYALLNQTTYDNERAVEIWCDGKMVGYIPKIELTNPLSYAEILILQVLYFEEKGIYCAELSERQEPTDEETKRVIEICNEKKLKMPIVVDKRAYAFFAACAATA